MKWTQQTRHSWLYERLPSRTQAEALGPYFVRVTGEKRVWQWRSMFLAIRVSSAQNVVLKDQRLYLQKCKTANFNEIRRKNESSRADVTLTGSWRRFQGTNEQRDVSPVAAEGGHSHSLQQAVSSLWAIGSWVTCFVFTHLYCENFLKWTSIILK